VVFNNFKTIIFITLIFISSASFSQESLLGNYNKLKNLLDNETISFNQFNKGIDNLLTESKDYRDLKDLFSSNVILEEDYKQILENIITNLSPQISKSKKEVAKKNHSNSKEIDLLFKIVFVGSRVPLELNAKLGNIEKLTIVIEENKVRELIIKDENNNLFNKNFASFKNIKINLKNNSFLQGKNKLLLNQFKGIDIIMWWQNLDISGDKYIGKIDIELPGKGPQIKLEAI